MYWSILPIESRVFLDYYQLNVEYQSDVINIK